MWVIYYFWKLNNYILCNLIKIIYPNTIHWLGYLIYFPTCGLCWYLPILNWHWTYLLKKKIFIANFYFSTDSLKSNPSPPQNDQKLLKWLSIKKVFCWCSLTMNNKQYIFFYKIYIFHFTNFKGMQYKLQ